jgi:hypothetical protein
MLAPGVPSDVAHAIASHENDPKAMAKSVVNDVMRTKYDAGDLGGFGPAAAFDVLDLDPAKMRLAESSIKRLNDDVGAEAGANGVRGIVRDDARAIQGMVRFPDASKDMPWRPIVRRLRSTTRLPETAVWTRGFATTQVPPRSPFDT